MKIKDRFFLSSLIHHVALMVATVSHSELCGGGVSIEKNRSRFPVFSLPASKAY